MAVAMNGGPGGAWGVATRLTIPKIRAYDPKAGDLWAAKVGRLAGTLVICPAGWTRSDDADEHFASFGYSLIGTWWWCIIATDDEPLPTFHFSRRGFCQIGLVAYRPPFDDPGLQEIIPDHVKEIVR